MTRWHTQSCSTPDVIVKYDTGSEGVPYCRACQRAPDPEVMVKRLQAVAGDVPFQPPPPDAEKGHMHLWWPHSVGYTDDSDTEDGVPDDPSVPKTSPAETMSSKTDTLDAIYPVQIDSENFRLACLSAVDDDKYPMHLNLETYRLDNCPAYEAVSYTWGGEDDDNTLRRPVYVGPYWDIAIQTKNCWEMLRFVRPQQRGFRLVWVDALCINQRDLMERSSQISNMRQIFSKAMQVIVYLGPDIAAPLPPGEYPQRERLQELGKVRPRLQRGGKSTEDPASEVTDFPFEWLLRRRYFSRLWVIQELFTSARSIFRIGDVDFWTDGRPMAVQSASEHWFYNIHKGSFHPQAVTELMEMTSSTHCSDPRDQIFGLLGLLDPKSDVLYADYSLSLQHMYIGLMADMLLNRHLCDILIFASGVEGSGSLSLYQPSWMPDWTSKEVLCDLWTSTRRRVTPALADDKFVFELKDSWDVKARGTMASSAKRKAFLLYLTYASTEFSSAFRDTRPKPQHLTKLTVNRRTAALTGDLARLMTIDSQPKLVQTLRPGEKSRDGEYVFTVPCKAGTLFLVSNFRLDTLVKAGVDAIYVVENFQERLSVYWILRSPSTADNSLRTEDRIFVALCTVALFRLHRIPPSLEDAATVERWSVGECRSYDYPAVHLCSTVLARKLPLVLEEIRPWWNAELQPFESLIFLGMERVRQALPVYLALLEETIPETATMLLPMFRAVYPSAFDDIFHPIIGQTFVCLFVQEEAFFRYCAWIKANWSDWSYEASSHIFQTFNMVEKLSADVKADLKQGLGWTWRTRSSGSLRVVIRLDKVREYLLRSEGVKMAYLLRQVSRRTGIAESELLDRDFLGLDERILVPTGPWSQVLVDEFGCDIDLDRVNII